MRRSLRASTAEGLLAEVIGACAGSAAWTAWALHLGASPLLIGLLAALPQMAQVFQVPAAWTTSWFGHKRACLWLVGVSRQVLLLLALLPLLPGSPASHQLWLLGVAGLSAVLGVLGNNAWVAWMSELCPRRLRGRYFGRRSALCMLGGALASAGTGALLDAAQARGRAALALAALQIFACATSVVTVWLMSRQADPRATDPAPPSVARALAPLSDRSVRALLRYQLAWNFAVGLSGSFFTLHMLRNLKMGFRLMALHGAAFAAFRMLSAPLWGRLLDRVGARPILVTCSFGLALVPFVWFLPSEARLWPLAIDAVVAGILWCGHALAIFALPMAVAPACGRPFYVAALSSAGGLSFLVAAVVAGAVSRVLPAEVPVFGHLLFGTQVLFLVSGLLRLLAARQALFIVEPSAQGVSALWACVRAAARLFWHRARAFASLPPLSSPEWPLTPAARAAPAIVMSCSFRRVCPELD